MNLSHKLEFAWEFGTNVWNALPVYSRRTSCVSSKQLPTKKEGKKNHGTQDSRVVPHRGTN